MSGTQYQHTSRRSYPLFAIMAAAVRSLPAIIFLGVAAACTGSPTAAPLPTLAEMPTENALPPEVEATRIANQQAPIALSDLSSVTVGDDVTFEGVLSFDSATNIAVVQTDNGTRVTLSVPPPLAQPLTDQRVLVSGRVTATGESLAVDVQGIAPAAEITPFPEVTSEVPMLPPGLGTQNAPSTFNISPNLTALASG